MHIYMIVISYGGEPLEFWHETRLEDALWLRDYYLAAGFHATITKA